MIADECRLFLVLACAIVNDRRTSSHAHEIPEPSFCRRRKLAAQECLQLATIDKFEAFAKPLFEQLPEPLRSTLFHVENGISRFSTRWC